MLYKNLKLLILYETKSKKAACRCLIYVFYQVKLLYRHSTCFTCLCYFSKSLLLKKTFPFPIIKWRMGWKHSINVNNNPSNFIILRLKILAYNLMKPTAITDPTTTSLCMRIHFNEDKTRNPAVAKMTTSWQKSNELTHNLDEYTLLSGT